MPNPIKILIVGRDAKLLEVRSMVLQSAGYQSWVTTNMADLDPDVVPQDLDLLILCHSLSWEQCGRALVFAQTRRPSLKTLVLTAGTARCSSTPLLEQVLDAMEGPVRLLQAVARITTPSHSALLLPAES